MSDPRIIKLSHSILESSIDAWNQVLSQDPKEAFETQSPNAGALKTGPIGSHRALLDLIHQVRARIPELYASIDSIDENSPESLGPESLGPESLGPESLGPEALGQRGLLAWMVWFSSQLEQTRLSEECKSSLRGSLQRAISMLSSCASVQESVEAASRRQVYELAYGLTHEINNPLGNILARAQQLLSKSTDPYDRKSLATVVDQAMRAHEMLAELMRAVQPRCVECQRIDLVPLVEEAFQRSQPLAKPKNLIWQLRKKSTVAPARVEAMGVLEALRLIAQNAIDAARESDSILWSIDEIGTSIRISIEDTGPGLSPQAVRRAFDLFYSGREAGRGLGVSLAVVRRLVSESGGSVRLESEKQLGCRVELRFPKSEPEGKAVSQGKPVRAWKL
jgi:signal transduction histidine kinase